ncbi:aminotransferase class I/II-fold pyridoxal phosphate-dependent enzyme, partial [Lysinibacillus fusiformis]|uniref:aminotransferase class I/II-fold pyridoxal phosphate-dependent enzyme n=1 Tax=Lysinibacillus fusiformis TaxID=28031 RepID=UPI00201BB5CC
AHDLDSMAAAIDDQTSIVWVCSPNIPTGVVIPDTALRAFLAKVPSDVLVVLGEAYIEYVTHPGHKDTLPIIDEYPNVLLLRTFSKDYRLASFLVG